MFRDLDYLEIKSGLVMLIQCRDYFAGPCWSAMGV